MDTKKKRDRKGIVLTDRHCQNRVKKRCKIYDRKCPGLYVSITTGGVATFAFKFKGHYGQLGQFSPDTFTVEHAREEVYRLKAKGADIGEVLHRSKVQKVARGKTINDLIEERIEWMKTPDKKDDGETRPLIESWENIAGHLRRFIGRRMGTKLATDITKHDIATLSNDIVAGRDGFKALVANARHMRRAASGLFNWAAEAGRDYVSTSPCVNLPKLKKEKPRDRVLTEDEIRTLWHGLDSDRLPWDRNARLGIKFALVTMLRSGEMLPIHRSELNQGNGTVDIPAKRVKKRRVIQQPLSDLAWEIIKEAMGDNDYVFSGRFGGGSPLSRQQMSGALTGTMKTVNGVKVKRTAGICELLGLEPFTPHDLRRTAATMCGELGLSESAISLCLDHQANKDDDGKALPTITAKVYNKATRIRVEKKRAVLDRWAVELRRIIGESERLAVAA